MQKRFHKRTKPGSHHCTVIIPSRYNLRLHLDKSYYNLQTSNIAITEENIIWSADSLVDPYQSFQVYVSYPIFYSLSVI